MKAHTFIFGFIVFVTLAGCVPGEPTEKWYACKKDTDCAIFVDNCGESRGVHKKYQAAIQAHQESGQPIDCPEPRLYDSVRVECLERVCVTIFSRDK